MLGAGHGRSEKARVEAAKWLLERAAGAPNYRVEIEEISAWELQRDNKEVLQIARKSGVTEIRQFPPGTRRLIVRHRDGTEITRTHVGDDGHHVQMKVVQLTANEASAEDMRPF